MSELLGGLCGPSTGGHLDQSALYALCRTLRISDSSRQESRGLELSNPIGRSMWSRASQRRVHWYLTPAIDDLVGSSERTLRCRPSGTRADQVSEPQLSPHQALLRGMLNAWLNWLLPSAGPVHVHETRAFARDIGLIRERTPCVAHRTDDTDQSFVETSKRDYAAARCAYRRDSAEAAADFVRWCSSLDRDDHQEETTVRLRPDCSTPNWYPSYERSAATLPRRWHYITSLVFGSTYL
jgi:hypothetical protein